MLSDSVNIWQDGIKLLKNEIAEGNDAVRLAGILISRESTTSYIFQVM